LANIAFLTQSIHSGENLRVSLLITQQFGGAGYIYRWYKKG
jgi:hypothetical protein